MKVKLNGVDIECTVEEFRELNLGKRMFPVRAKKTHRKGRKGTFARLQRTLSPVLGVKRGAIGRWSKEDDNYLLENYRFATGQGGNYSPESIEKIEKICHRLGRTPRAIRQRVWQLQRERKAE